MTAAQRSLTLHHVALGAVDVERVAAFYRDVFGLPEHTRHHDAESGKLRSIWLEMGTALLMVEHSAAAPRPVEGVSAGPFLLAFRVDAGVRAAWEERLSAAGAAIENRTAWSSYARDPEGNRVAVSTY